MKPGLYPTAFFTQLEVLEISAGNLEIILNVYSLDPKPDSLASSHSFSTVSLPPSFPSSSHCLGLLQVMPIFFLSLFIFSHLFAHHGPQTHDPEIKSLPFLQLSQPGAPPCLLADLLQSLLPELLASRLALCTLFNTWHLFPVSLSQKPLMASTHQQREPTLRSLALQAFHVLAPTYCHLPGSALLVTLNPCESLAQDARLSPDLHSYGSISLTCICIVGC